jgi:hypothetical protein
MKMQVGTLAFGLVALAGRAPAQVAQQMPAAVTTATLDNTVTDNTVTVQNNRKVPVTVYMEYGQFDRRLGTVAALQTGTVPLPAWAVKGRDRIQLFVHPEGEIDDLGTQELSLQPPGRIGMIVPAWGNRPAPADTMMAAIPPEELADATLTVDNPRSKPVTIFAEQADGPFDVRLGQVPANSRVTLQFPKSVVFPDETIQIVVHPDGGVDLASETLQVHRGEHLGLRVPLH